jgi:hypothetical protein
MTVRAVCSFTHVVSDGIPCAAVVDLLRDGLKMVGVPAQLVTAQVIKMQAFRDLSAELRPADPVREVLDPIAVSDLAVMTVAVPTALPDPAAC